MEKIIPAQHSIKPPGPRAQPKNAPPRLPQLVRRDETPRRTPRLALGHGLLDLVDLELAEALDLEEAAAGAHCHQLQLTTLAQARQMRGKWEGVRRWYATWLL